MPKTPGWSLVVAHAVVALALLLLYLVVRWEFAAVADGPEDGVLLLPVLVPLLLLSLPWSLSALTDPAVAISEGWLVVAAFANVGLHGLIIWLWRRARGPQAR